MTLSAHGLSVELPRGWSGRVFRPAGSGATLHCGSFGIALRDGQFGDESTGRMPRPGAFLALTEYVPGAGLRPGHGLFSARKVPRALDPAAFSARCLAHPRPGHAGWQRFFTAAGRPLCLYVVLNGSRSERHAVLLAAERVLRSLRVEHVKG